MLKFVRRDYFNFMNQFRDNVFRSFPKELDQYEIELEKRRRMDSFLDLYGQWLETKDPGLEPEIIDIVLLYDVLHYFIKDERIKLYQEVFRVLKEGGLLSVYPKHIAEDNPLMELQHIRSTDVRQEILSSGFQFERRHCGVISHDDGLNKGCVLNFRKLVGKP